MEALIESGFRTDSERGNWSPDFLREGARRGFSTGAYGNGGGGGARILTPGNEEPRANKGRECHPCWPENYPKTAVGMDETAQVVGAERLWKNRRRTRSGPVRFFQRHAAQQVAQDRHEQLPLLGLFAFQKPRQVAGGMHHMRRLDAADDGTVKNQVVAEPPDLKGAQIAKLHGRKLSRDSHAWSARQVRKGRLGGLEQPVGGFKVVEGDILSGQRDGRHTWRSFCPSEALFARAESASAVRVVKRVTW